MHHQPLIRNPFKVFKIFQQSYFDMLNFSNVNFHTKNMNRTSDKSLKLFKMFWKLFKNRFNCSLWINCHQLSLFVVHVYDFHRFLLECLKSLPNHFNVIIWPSACLASFQKTFFKRFLTAFKIYNERNSCWVSYYFLPYFIILDVPWETVNQKFGACWSLHGFFQ